MKCPVAGKNSFIFTATCHRGKHFVAVSFFLSKIFSPRFNSMLYQLRNQNGVRKSALKRLADQTRNHFVQYTPSWRRYLISFYCRHLIKPFDSLQDVNCFNLKVIWTFAYIRIEKQWQITNRHQNEKEQVRLRIYFSAAEVTRGLYKYKSNTISSFSNSHLTSLSDSNLNSSRDKKEKHLVKDAVHYW